VTRFLCCDAYSVVTVGRHDLVELHERQSSNRCCGLLL
jgi:hypothetical protein